MNKVGLLSTLYALFIIHAANAQTEYPVPVPSLPPSKTTAVDVTTDGAMLAIGGEGVVQVMDIIGGYTVFGAHIQTGLAINAVKLSPDKTKLIVIAENRFITIFDIDRGEILMTSDVPGYTFLPLDIKKMENHKRGEDDQVRVAFENCAVNSFEDRFKFIDDRLLIFTPISIIEYFFGESRTPLTKPKERDFLEVQFELQREDTFPHVYNNMPWACRYDSVIARNYRRVLFDPTGTYGLVEYQEKLTTHIEVWDILKGNLVHKRAGDLPYPESIDNKLLALDSSGNYIYYYDLQITDREKLTTAASLVKVSLANFRIQQKLVDFPGNSSIVALKLSPNNKYLFFEEVNFKSQELREFLGKVKIEGNPPGIINTGLLVYDQQSKKLTRRTFGNTPDFNISFSALSDACFIATGTNIYKYDTRDSLLFPYYSMEQSPRILNTVIDSTGNFWIISDNDIRRFNLFSSRQELYYPVGKIDAFTMDHKREKGYYADSDSVHQVDLGSGAFTPLYKHGRKVSAVTWNEASGQLLSVDYNNTPDWSDSCMLLAHDPSGNQVKPVAGAGGASLSLALSPDRRYMANLAQGKNKYDAKGLIKAFYRSINSKGNVVYEKMQLYPDIEADKHFPGEIRLLKFQQGKWVTDTILETHETITRNEAFAMAFSPDNRYLVSSDANLQLNVWNIKTRRKIARMFSVHGDDFTRRKYYSLNENGPVKNLQTSFRITAICFSPDGKHMVTGGNDGNLIWWTRVPGQQGDDAIFPYEIDTILNKDNRYPSVTSVNFSPDGKLLLAGTENGNVLLFDAETNSFFSGISLKKNSEGYMVLGPNSCYFANPEGRDLLYFKNGRERYSSEQFDLYYNRPDYLRSYTTYQFFSMVPDEPLFYARFFNEKYLDSAAVRKRFSIYNKAVEVVPPVEMLNYHAVNLENRTALLKRSAVSGEHVLLEISCKSVNANLAAIHVWNNGVPVFGSKGIKLAAGKTSTRQTIRLRLSPGANRLQISSENDKGLLSKKESILLFHSNRNFKPDLYLVTLGVNDYDHYEKLSYARKDCIDLIKGFEKNKTAYRQIHVDTFFNRRVTLQAVKGLRAKLQNARPGDLVLIYYSGHGFQNRNHELYLGMSATNRANLSKTGLPFSVLDKLLDSIDCRQKLLLLDACQTGLRDRTGGTDSNGPVAKYEKGSYEPADKNDSVFLRMQELFMDLSPGSGTITIAASTGYQSARELDNLQNGVFTQALVNALSGNRNIISPADINSDSRVTISELLSYLKKEVPVLNKNQTPTTRSINLVNDFIIW